MGNVHTPQRRALESLKPEEVRPLVISIKDRYYFNGNEIFLLGISEGIGTCSDLHGINIAVFGQKELSSPRFPRGKTEVNCSWVALLRKPTDEELKQEGHDSRTPCLIVEEIEILGEHPIKKDKTIYNFIATGKKKIYVNTIC